MDIKKLRELSSKIQEKAINEILENSSESIYNLTNSNVINYCLHQNKSGIKANVTPKLLNDWIKKDVVQISENDKGKIKRFDTIESIWINLLIDLRKFGLSLEKIKHIREQLDYQIKNFTFFKYNIIKSIFGEDNYMLIYETGEISFISIRTYQKLTKRGRFPIHLTVRFSDYVSKVFKNNSFDTEFEHLQVDDDFDKMKLLFFLKTNFFKEIRLKITKVDTRLIIDSKDIFNNEQITDCIKKWNFHKIQIIINDDVETEITN